MVGLLGHCLKCKFNFFGRDQLAGMILNSNLNLVTWPHHQIISDLMCWIFLHWRNLSLMSILFWQNTQLRWPVLKHFSVRIFKSILQVILCISKFSEEKKRRWTPHLHTTEIRFWHKCFVHFLESNG
jgi:hypothetical protein